MNRIMNTGSILGRGRLVLLVAIAASMLLAACGGGDQQDPRRVGILDFLGRESLLDGFKAELTAGGFVEGEDVVYVVEHIERDLAEIGPAVERLLAEDVELIFSISTPATIQAKQAALPLGVSVVFAPVTDPVSSGIVESLTHPGSSITGVRTGGSYPKLIEWFHVLRGSTEATLFVPHNPDDQGSVQGLNEVAGAAAVLGVELIVREVHSTQDIEAAVATLPNALDGILILPSAFLVAHQPILMAAAADAGLPVIGPNTIVESGGTLGFGTLVDSSLGAQAGRLALKILNGTPASDLPVETAEFKLGINIPAATAAGLTVPDQILAQASITIR
jgi:putative tryptophan/tyrosine transport system substrate-binding protein